jgi:hypothetical protein
MPVIPDVRTACRETGADAIVTYVPAVVAFDAVLDACNAGCKVVVYPDDGLPVQDAIELHAAARANGAVIVGPNTPGVISRSGSLSYKAATRSKASTRRKRWNCCTPILIPTPVFIWAKSAATTNTRWRATPRAPVANPPRRWWDHTPIRKRPKSRPCAQRECMWRTIWQGWRTQRGWRWLAVDSGKLRNILVWPIGPGNDLGSSLRWNDVMGFDPHAIRSSPKSVRTPLFSRVGGGCDRLRVFHCAPAFRLRCGGTPRNSRSSESLP